LRPVDWVELAYPAGYFDHNDAFREVDALEADYCLGALRTS
jgi:hypothetical protein